ncbi:multifunctional 2',3'-cyclic-nucleotide 2'-phosphodiesterase/5'-nucleotidase/3'-nucleotidase [Fructilactobacillus lindneri]|uniref:Uncharacterized protein n=2 Tax=Fructilactobacillus lindneri TaxID=53444 RepID=A0A0R2JY74_9LACO|nr:metallophosphoesterase [Fructilactobacillus lindneri]ANZ58308.1 multifunctional 2',3'-cyclic-nucleotide 2'-phosphodiesterase/5'-nucleotidase/3'-nucleotidase [Fructilactobacillus lindneri]ANZ59630.1 multifunctional 2',3'-cyclic-nucleotide 2'-phosphodiesterase/5'-nucleotidase/3'-nucleotidase [Fructilactobacillus lindneri]KRN79140.1 hypothetical protein IV52_GL000546 [Fructilactobacillus lindneri DSM 20690 = JCM 11027]POG98586.1 multifunctional 2',3'-cyclic-nucleotide 2'-phosphodiesterase/5'-nu
MKTKVAILHTNDLHSHFENVPKIIRFMKSQTDKLRAAGYTVFKVDDGDAIDRFNPLTDATSGKGNIEILNKMNYDVATIGNNEALTNSHSELNDLYNQANFQIVLDNVIDEDTGKAPVWAKSFADYKLKNGTKLRFMALTCPYPTFKFMDWKVLPVMPTIAADLKKWQGDYDVLILLSHLGINYDRKIAKAFPEISIIVGGHTHHLLEHGEMVQQTLLTAAEKWGHYVGQITFEVDGSEIFNRDAKVFKVSEMEAEDTDFEMISAWNDKGKKLLASQKVAKLPQKLKNNLLEDNPLIEIGLKAIEQATDTDAAVLNTGLFLDDLPKGIVDMNQIHKILPHNIHVMKTEFLGYNLWRMVKEMEKNKGFLIRFTQKGMGFRGKNFGLLIYDGIKYDQSKQQLFWHDKLVLPDQKYKIALIDHYDFIPFFPTISIVGKNTIYFNGTLENVFAKYLAKKYPL